MNRIFCVVVFLWTSIVCLAEPSIHGERVYLSGRDAGDAVEWDFFCSEGRKSGKWMKIAVPSHWEQEGFGSYNYGHDDPLEKHAEVGTYRRDFFVPMAWKDKHVRLVFEGVMTQASVKINGKPVGFDNYGGYTAFHHVLDKSNITYGKSNRLEVVVKKKPDNDSLDRAERKADYWVFGGIYRPVYLEVLPKEFVNRVAIDARADGLFKMDVFPQVQYPTKFWQKFMIYTDEVTAQIQTLEGVNVGEPMRAKIHGSRGRIKLETMVENPLCWSPENPNRYQVKVQMLYQGSVLSEMTQRFGFRSVELRPGDGFYLNGIKQRIKGINRNMFDPDHGRVISEERAWADALAITAFDAMGREVMHWVLDSESTVGLPERDGKSIVVKNNGKRIEVVVGEIKWVFSAATGQLLDGLLNGKTLGLTRGPFRQAGTLEEEPLTFAARWKVTSKEEADHLLIRSTCSDGSWFEWKINTVGDAQLRYSFELPDAMYTYAAIGFDLDENQLEGKRWLGRGPHRVWGNRMRGPRFGVWQDLYNDDVVGLIGECLRLKVFLMGLIGCAYI